MIELTAVYTLQLYRLDGVVALLHDTFQRTLRDSGGSQKMFWCCKYFIVVFMLSQVK